MAIYVVLVLLAVVFLVPLYVAVVGSFKTIAETYLGPLGLSIPTVIYGLNFSARTAGKEQWITVPFTCGEEALDVKVCLTPNRGLPRMAGLRSAHIVHY